MSQDWKQLVIQMTAKRFADDSNERDMLRLTKDVMEEVDTFCINHNLIKAASNKNNVRHVVESMDADVAIANTNDTAIVNLLLACGVSERVAEKTKGIVANIIGKYLSSTGKGEILFSEQNRIFKNTNTEAVSVRLEDIFSSSAVSMFNHSFSTEDIGVGMATITPDLRMAISVAIMQFHQGITSRLVHVRNAVDPVIQYKRSDLKVFNVAEPEELDTDLIELFKNPTKDISNELLRMKLIKANDSVTDPVMWDDDAIFFNVEANALELSNDMDVYGHGRLNRTDLVADGVRIEKVFFRIQAGVNNEVFSVEVPYPISKLVHVNNAIHSGIRGASIPFATFLNANSKQVNGTPSAILAGLNVDEGLAVEFMIKPEINLRNGKINTLGSIVVRKHHVNAGVISPDLNTVFASLFVDPLKRPALVAYTPDIRFDEQNLRKSQTACRVQTRHIVQPLPPAKNYILDTTIFQTEEDNGASHLTQLIRIGQDHKTLTTVSDAIKRVYDMSKEMYSNPLIKGIDPGHHYVAGSIVRPRAIITQMDMDDIMSIRDSDRGSDIAAIARLKISYLLEQLFADTMLLPQLPPGMRPVLRVATSNVIMNSIFAVPHIHNHLNAHSYPNQDGIEYTVVLDSGVRLEFVTSLFEYMKDQAIMIPIIPNDASSILNFGHNHEHGTVVGSYNHTYNNATWQRMFAQTREFTYPTLPIGIIINFTNIDKAIRRA